MNTSLDSTHPTGPDAELPRVQELLPWYAMGALVGDEQHFVETWLARHGADHPELQAELAWLRGTATLARENAREHAAEAGLGELMARIGAERSTRPLTQPSLENNASVGQRVLAWLADVLAPRRPALALGVAAVLLAQAVVIGSLLTNEPSEQRALSGNQQTAIKDAVIFTVAWRSDAREADIRALLNAAQAQVIAGPSALGLYRVAVPSTQALASLALLQNATQVVETVQQEP
jgi:hypothetical protein